MRSAESRLEGSDQANAPTEAAVEEIWALPPQPLLVAIVVPELLSCNCGSGRNPDKPNSASAGPEARNRMVFDVTPPTTKPATRTPDPVPTSALLAMLIRRCGATWPGTVGVAS